MGHCFDDHFLPAYIAEALRKQGRWHVVEFPRPDGLVIRHLHVDRDVLRTIARELRSRRQVLLGDGALWNRESLLRRLAGLQLLAREIVLPGAPLRQEMLEILPHLSGISEKMVAILFDSLEDLLVRTGWAAVARSLPPNQAARQWIPTAEGYARYYPGPLGLSWPGLLALSRRLASRPVPLWPVLGTPALVCNIASGNVPGMALMQALLAVSIGAASLGKNASAEPYSGPRLLQELAALEAQRGVFPLSDLIALVTFSGTEQSLLEELIHQSDHLQATGGQESKSVITGMVSRLRFRSSRDLRRQVSRHWHKISFDIISREYLTSSWIQTVAANVAMDNAMFNTQGCLSAQQVLVEGDQANALYFCVHLVEQMQDLLERLPKGRGAGEGLREMYMAYENKTKVRIITRLSDLAHWPIFVAYEDEPEQLPAFSTLNRSILVRRVDSLETALPRLLGEGKWRDLLQSCGVAIPQERLLPIAEMLGRAGVKRIVAAGDIWNLRLGRDSWDGYLPPTDLLVPQLGYWATVAFEEADKELQRVHARNETLLGRRLSFSGLEFPPKQTRIDPHSPGGQQEIMSRLSRRPFP